MTEVEAFSATTVATAVLCTCEWPLGSLRSGVCLRMLLLFCLLLPAGLRGAESGLGGASCSSCILVIYQCGFFQRALGHGDLPRKTLRSP